MNLYEILNVSEDATDREIKIAFKSMAQMWHPDKENGCELRFAKIKEAYDILKDKDKRACYDETGRVNFSPIEREAENHIVQVFSQMIDQNVQGDIVENSVNKFKEALQGLQRDKNKFSTLVNRIAKKRGMVILDGSGENIFEMLLDDKEKKAKSALDESLNLEQVVNTAIKILENYSDSSPKEIPVILPTNTGTNRVFFTSTGA